MGLFDPAWMKKDHVSGKEWSSAEKAFQKMDSGKLADTALAVKDPKVAVSAVKRLKDKEKLKEVAERTTFWQVRSEILKQFIPGREDVLLNWVISEDANDELKQDALHTLRESLSYLRVARAFDAAVKMYQDADRAHPGLGLDELAVAAKKGKEQSFTNRELICKNCGGHIVYVHEINRYSYRGTSLTTPYNLYVCSKCGDIWQNGELDARVEAVNDKPYKRNSSSYVFACPVCLRLKSVRISPGLANGIGEFDFECGCEVPEDIYPATIPVEHKSSLSLGSDIFDKIMEWIKQKEPKDSQESE